MVITILQPLDTPLLFSMFKESFLPLSCSLGKHNNTSSNRGLSLFQEEDWFFLVLSSARTQFCQGTHIVFKWIRGGQMERKVGGAIEFVDISISQGYSLSQSSNVIHAKESNCSPPCHWLLETADPAPKFCCLLRDFNQTCLCYLGFLCWQQKLPSGSISFNRFYWPISSVCSPRKPGQFFKIYRHSKNFNN